jgi:hypothetical protein
MAPFIYSPLRKPESDLRLIEIDHDSPNDSGMVRCRMFTGYEHVVPMRYEAFVLYMGRWDEKGAYFNR